MPTDRARARGSTTSATVTPGVAQARTTPASKASASSRGAVDTQFALTPGQSRAATFNIIRFNAKPPIGNAWNYDVVIDEVEVLPGQVVRSARQNSLSFASLTAGTFRGATAQAPEAADVANKVLDLFNRKKKN